MDWTVSAQVRIASVTASWLLWMVSRICSWSSLLAVRASVIWISSLTFVCAQYIKQGEWFVKRGGTGRAARSGAFAPAVGCGEPGYRPGGHGGAPRCRRLLLTGGEPVSSVGCDGGGVGRAARVPQAGEVNGGPGLRGPMVQHGTRRFEAGAGFAAELLRGTHRIHG